MDRLKGTMEEGREDLGSGGLAGGGIARRGRVQGLSPSPDLNPLPGSTWTKCDCKHPDTQDEDC